MQVVSVIGIVRGCVIGGVGRKIKQEKKKEKHKRMGTWRKRKKRGGGKEDEGSMLAKLIDNALPALS